MPFEEREIFPQPLSAQEIRAILGQRSPLEIFSWNSPSAKAAGITRETVQTQEELIRLMAGEPRLIRRPLIQVDGELVIGADLRRLQELLQRR